MFVGHSGHYFSVGLDAANIIDSILQENRLAQPQKILDLPSGHGRVLRFLKTRYPQAQFTACDLNQDAIKFCAARFGASPCVSSNSFRDIPVNDQYNLIWCGSLITHLKAPAISDLLNFFYDKLSLQGILIFTTIAEEACSRLRSGITYDLNPRDIANLIRDYEKSGFGYAQYPGNRRDYGLTLTAPSWIRNEVSKIKGLKELYFAKTRWDKHQDAFAFIRNY